MGGAAFDRAIQKPVGAHVRALRSRALIVARLELKDPTVFAGKHNPLYILYCMESPSNSVIYPQLESAGRSGAPGCGVGDLPTFKGGVNYPLLEPVAMLL